MTHEQFITRNTARLAKQAGFDWESRFDNRQQRDEWQQVALVEVSNPDYNDAMGDPYSDEFIPFMSLIKFVMLPHVTQAVLQRWLREVKRVDIIVELAIIDDIDVPYSYDLWIADKEYASKNSWRTYEAALEAGLQKCLTLLIEKQ